MYILKNVNFSKLKLMKVEVLWCIITVICFLYLFINYVLFDNCLPKLQNTNIKPANLNFVKSKTRYCKKEELQSSWFLSQSSEDQHLMFFFKNYCNGVYVELGALDGLTYSNTYVFNKGLDWKGILIELSPLNFESLKKNRLNELAIINAAICETNQTVHYVESGAVGAVWEFTTAQFRNSWWGSEKTIQNAMPIQCLPLRDIFSKIDLVFFADIFSLDVEGAELEVLYSIDFNATAFGVILIESGGMNITKNLAVREFLSMNGYIFLYYLRESDWFINKHFNEIYPNFLSYHELSS